MTSTHNSAATLNTDVLVVGAGSIGVSIAYYLKKCKPHVQVTLVDPAPPLSFTSAQSGENFRNWWPHPIMKEFMDRSIELMEQISTDTENRIQLSHRGYLLATRDSAPQTYLDNFNDIYTNPNAIRHHTSTTSYNNSLNSTDTTFQDGVDIIDSAAVISKQYPRLDNDIRTLFHIRRGGMLSAQQLGAYMLENIKQHNGKVIQGQVDAIDHGDDFSVNVKTNDADICVQANIVVNAAGPYAKEVSGMLSSNLPVVNILQQKIAFQDTSAAIERTMPFAIDLDEQTIAWSDDERDAMASEPGLSYLLNTLPGSIHCRPEGGDNSNWVKLGWAFNDTVTQPSRNPELDDFFPEIVVRGAARLNPELATYLDGFPGTLSHYGGYYTMTEENWPLIGASDIPGFYLATAMSGFGTMAACGTGELLAQQIIGNPLPAYAKGLSPTRYQDETLMAEIAALQSRGIL